jgi:hypothetical protein
MPLVARNDKVIALNAFVFVNSGSAHILPPQGCICKTIHNARSDKTPHSRSKCNKSRSDLKRCFVAQAFSGPVVNQ